MGQVLDFGKLTASAPSQVGDGGLRLDGLAYQSTPERPEGVLVWAYTVATGEKLTMKSLAMWLYNAVFATGQATGAAINGAVWKIRQGTTDKLEGRLHAWPIMGNTPGADECQVYGYNCNQRLNFGDGITLTSSDTLNVTVTPDAANAGVAYFATAIGALAGTPAVQKGILVPSATTADQAVLSYTPPSDFTLYSVTIEAVCFGSAVIAGARLEVNGMTALELPPLGMAEGDPVFNGSSGDGVIWIPMEGIEFKDGDRLALYAHPFVNAGHVVAAQLAGSSEAYGSGGSGNTYSRGRVVNG